MPIKKTDKGFKFGDHGKVYKKKEDAVKQARAMFAAGYKEPKKKK